MSRQFARFLFVGAVGFCIDTGGVLLLIHWGVSPILARIPSTSLSMITTWLLNRAVTFRVEKPKSRRELTRYLTIAVASATLNFVIYSAFVLAGIHPLLAVILATAILLLFSFFAYRNLVFHESPHG